MTKRENIQGAAAALLALAGVVLMTVRPWGMRLGRLSAHLPHRGHHLCGAGGGGL